MKNYPMVQTGLLAAFMLAACCGTSRAAGTLSIRLVHATQQKTASAEGLSDVAGVLQRGIPYNHFRLVGSSALSLPAGGSCALSGYRVECSGTQAQLTIRVNRGAKTLINTTVSLRDNTPLVLGGLPASDGKLLLVFVAR